MISDASLSPQRSSPSNVTGHRPRRPDDAHREKDAHPLLDAMSNPDEEAQRILDATQFKRHASGLADLVSTHESSSVSSHEDSSSVSSQEDPEEPEADAPGPRSRLRTSSKGKAKEPPPRRIPSTRNAPFPLRRREPETDEAVSRDSEANVSTSRELSFVSNLPNDLAQHDVQLLTQVLVEWWSLSVETGEKLGALEESYGRAPLARTLLQIVDTHHDTASIPHRAAAALLLTMAEKHQQSVLRLVADDSQEPGPKVIEPDKLAADSNAIAAFVTDHLSDEPEEVAKLLCLRLDIPPRRICTALMHLAATGDASIARLCEDALAELLHGNLRTNAVPVKVVEWSRQFVRTLLNMLRGGLSQFLAKTLTQVVASMLLAPLSPAVGGIIAVIAAGTMQILALWRLNAMKSAEYRNHPSNVIRALETATTAIVLLAPCAYIGALISGSETILAAVTSAALALASNQFARGLREVFHEWFRSDHCAPMQMLNSDFSTLSAREQWNLNAERDGGYLASSFIFLCVAPALASTWLTEATRTPANVAEGFQFAARLSTFTSINDALEESLHDLSRLFTSLTRDGFVLVEGSMKNPRCDATLFLNHSATRVTGGPIIDVFVILKTLQGSIGWTTAQAIANALVGGGRYRSELTNYIRNPAGTNPDGLLHACLRGISITASFVGKHLPSMPVLPALPAMPLPQIPGLFAMPIAPQAAADANV